MARDKSGRGRGGHGQGDGRGEYVLGEVDGESTTRAVLMVETMARAESAQSGRIAQGRNCEVEAKSI